MNAISGKRILVVDDDLRICELLKKFLTDQGFDVYVAHQTLEARSILLSQSVDVIVLDVMMPKESGLSFLEDLRKTSSIPVLMLTACDELEDKVQAFQRGSDDYLCKPFEPLELSYRIQSLIRRQEHLRKTPSQRIPLGDFVFDLVTTTLLDASGEEVPLSPSEQTLLGILANRPNTPFSREDLSSRMGYKVGDRTVDVQINRLRRKINDDPKTPSIIRTVRHIGYGLYIGG